MKDSEGREWQSVPCIKKESRLKSASKRVQGIWEKSPEIDEAFFLPTKKYTLAHTTLEYTFASHSSSYSVHLPVSVYKSTIVGTQFPAHPILSFLFVVFFSVLSRVCVSLLVGRFFFVLLCVSMSVCVCI